MSRGLAPAPGWTAPLAADLRERMEERGWSIEQLRRAATRLVRPEWRGEISRAQVRAVLEARERPNMRVLFCVGRALGVEWREVGALLFGDDDED